MTSSISNDNARELQARAPLADDVDVLVVGGGPAGIAAAVGAARAGARTMLIERTGCLGGVATNSLIGVWLGSYSRDGRYPVVGGVFDEVVEAMVAEGMAVPARDDVTGGTRHVGYASWHGRAVAFEFEACKRVTEECVLEAGVRLRYFTTFVAPEVRDGRISGVYTHSKNGFEFIRARTVVDGSGDADVACQSGCPVWIGMEDEDRPDFMPLVTLAFVVEDVDSGAFAKYCRETGDTRFRQAIARRKAEGRWPYDTEIIIGCEMPRRGRFFMNGPLHIKDINALDADDLTRAMTRGRKNTVAAMTMLRETVPGFENARLVQSASVIGVRTTRRIRGLYKLTNDDVDTGRGFKDTVALSGYRWDMPAAPGTARDRDWSMDIEQPYTEIPYRCLVPQEVDNLIVAGRSVSTDWDPMGVVRIMPCCFAMGQAAGLAASMVVRGDSRFDAVDTDELRERLTAQGAILQPGPAAGKA